MAFEIAPDADDDLRGIWLYTFDTWGEAQADRYFDQIVGCCAAIGDGEGQARRLELFPERVFFHRCRRHFIFYLEASPRLIIAILHERVDMLARLSDRIR